MTPVLLLLLAAQPLSPPPNERSTPKPPSAPAPKKPLQPYCQGEYANEYAALNKRTIEFNSRQESQFTYCVRVTATYECLSYATDGNVKRAKKSVTAHGTAFAYKKQGGDTLLATNFHVTEFPPVSDDDHPVDGVPVGCKKVSDTLKLVDNEKDAYETDDISLSRVVQDPQLDVSVVRAKAVSLSTLPWKFGKSANLRERNVVDVRGFPLGAFKATSQGKVISTYDRDDYKDWDHQDFVVDAALSSGNSGSPVLAVSCATGEYELVGIFHANYSRGNQLNLVVHIDDVRDLLTTLKRSKTNKSDNVPLDLAARKRLFEDASDSGMLFFPLGSLAAMARPRSDGALIYQVFSRDFPTDPWPALVLEDLPSSDPGDFGDPGRVWFGNARGLREVLSSELDVEARGQVEKTLESLRRTAILSTAHRRAEANEPISREAHELSIRLERTLSRSSNRDKELAQWVLDLSDRESPRPTQLALPVSRPFSIEPEAGAPAAP